MDATNITFNSVKESGAAKMEMLISKHEELTKEVHNWDLFDNLEIVCYTSGW